MANAKKLQRQAREAHKAGKRALAKGDVKGAMKADDKARDLAEEALLQRIRDRTAARDRGEL